MYKKGYLVSSASEFNHCQEYLFSKGCSWYSVNGWSSNLMSWPKRYGDVHITDPITTSLYLLIDDNNKMFYQWEDSAHNIEITETKIYGVKMREYKLKRILK